jgi:hypothetical protein
MFAQGEYSADLELGPQHADGMLGDPADAALEIAGSTTLEDAESFTMPDLTTKFMKPL